jgi:hypothetical protein
MPCFLSRWNLDLSPFRSDIRSSFHTRAVQHETEFRFAQFVTELTPTVLYDFRLRTRLGWVTERLTWNLVSIAKAQDGSGDVSSWLRSAASIYLLSEKRGEILDSIANGRGKGFVIAHDGYFGDPLRGDRPAQFTNA